ncbi:MAG: DUF3298 domain-containing protein [Bacteroidales bacterium]|nr:DUF3298 domain-containing protein [Bacteroidales bacterium]
MKRLFNYFIITLLSVFFSANSLNSFGQGRYLHMKGVIGNNEPITADLVISENRVEGFYNNNNRGQRISIAIYGDVMKDGTISVNDKISDQLIFTGKIVNGNEISGMWEKNDSDVKYPFSLKEEYSGGSIPYKLYSVRSKTSLTGAKDSPVALFEASVILPPDTMNRKSAQNLSNVVFSRFYGSEQVQEPKTLFKEMESRFFSHYNNSNSGINTPENYQFLNWEKRKNMLVMFNEQYITTMQFSDYAYTGGAFGLNIEKYLVFDVSTGRDLKLADLFAPGFYDKLGLLISNRIKENLKISQDDQLSRYGFFADTVVPTENFYINTSGIGFRYNTYEIAGMDAGTQDIFINFSELKRLLVSDHPFAWLR